MITTLLSFDCFILDLFIYSFFYFTVAVKELSGDEYLLRLSMISALQGLLKVSENLSEKLHLFFRLLFCKWSMRISWSVILFCLWYHG